MVGQAEVTVVVEASLRVLPRTAVTHLVISVRGAITAGLQCSNAVRGCAAR